MKKLLTSEDKVHGSYRLENRSVGGGTVLLFCAAFTKIVNEIGCGRRLEEWAGVSERAETQSWTLKHHGGCLASAISLMTEDDWWLTTNCEWERKEKTNIVDDAGDAKLRKHVLRQQIYLNFNVVYRKFQRDASRSFDSFSFWFSPTPCIFLLFFFLFFVFACSFLLEPSGRMSGTKRFCLTSVVVRSIDPMGNILCDCSLSHFGKVWHLCKRVYLDPCKWWTRSLSQVVFLALGPSIHLCTTVLYVLLTYHVDATNMKEEPVQRSGVLCLFSACTMISRLLLCTVCGRRMHAMSSSKLQ